MNDTSLASLLAEVFFRMYCNEYPCYTEFRAFTRELAHLLVSFVHLLVSFVHLLVSFVHLLVSLNHLLVSFAHLLVSWRTYS
ncbi:hypothetical protein ABIE66_005085 [Peribacillus sp. B2I2]